MTPDLLPVASSQAKPLMWPRFLLAVEVEDFSRSATKELPSPRREGQKPVKAKLGLVEHRGGTLRSLPQTPASYNQGHTFLAECGFSFSRKYPRQPFVDGLIDTGR